MILQLHSVLYVAKLPNVGRLGEAVADFLFDQPGYRICRNLQDAYQDQLETVLEIYKDDFLKLEPEVQLLILKPLCRDVCN